MGLTEINRKTEQIMLNVPKVYEAGQNAGGGESVPNYLYYGTRFDSTFVGAVFPENFEFVLRVQRLSAVNSLNGTFNNCSNLKSIKLINENPNDLVLNMQNTFAIASGNSPTLEIIDITGFNRKFSTCLNTFRYQKKLKSVFGKIDLSACISTANMFQNCEALEDVEFESETIKLSISFAQSSKLSANSIQSIIDGLATVTTAQTITFHGSIVLTDTQKATISSKGWTLAQ